MHSLCLCLALAVCLLSGIDAFPGSGHVRGASSRAVHILEHTGIFESKINISYSNKSLFHGLKEININLDNEAILQ